MKEEKERQFTFFKKKAANFGENMLSNGCYLENLPPFQQIKCPD